MKLRHRTSIVCLLALAPCLPVLADTAAPPTAPTATKPYMLFVGADMTAEWQGRLYPIRGVSAKGLVIDVDGRSVTVSPTSDGLRIQGKPSLKVAPTGIEISKLQVLRAYTPENDPKRAREIAEQNATAMAGKADEDQYRSNLAAFEAITYVSSSYGPDLSQQLWNSYGQSAATSEIDRSASTTDLGPSGAGMVGETGGSYDALQLSFDVSSRAPATGVYMMLAVRIRASADKAAPQQVAFLGENIGDLGPAPKTVRMFTGGFPPGYSLVGAQVHLYDSRGELGTNVAPKHMEITADEAFQISVAEYVGRHRGEDLPPSQVATGLSGISRLRLFANPHGHTYYVKLGKNGVPQGAFLDEACTQPISEQVLSSVFMGLRFYPALKAGKPVESVVPVKP